MSTLEIERRGDVAVLRMVDGENRFNRTSIDRWHEVLGELEATAGPLAVVVTGDGKFFSNGLDLDWFGEHPEQAGGVVDDVHRLLGRLLVLPAYTVAAMNGHAFAGGAMLSCACDVRVMRDDRGYWCLPEVDLGMPFTDGMNALIPARVPPMTAHEAMVTGRRYSGADALAAGIVNEIAAEDQVLARAVDVAQSLSSKAGPGIAGIRMHLHAPVLAHLQGTDRG